MDRPAVCWHGTAGVLMTVAAAGLHVVYLLHAGGLWRDEAGGVQLAVLPAWGDLWELLTHDSFPALFPAIVRAWCGMGWGATDFGLRVLGLVIGLLLVVAIWTAGLMMRRGVPLLPLALVALNVTVIRAGDSLRAYGLGSTLCVLLLALMWRQVRKPSVGNGLLAGLAAVLSVQCLYQNACFVFATGCGGIAVCVLGRRWRDVLGMLAIGGAAAVSLIPYVRPVLRAQEWWVVEKAGFTLSNGWNNFSAAAGFPFPMFNWVWVALCLGAAGVVLTTARRPAPAAGDNPRRDLVRFSGVTLAVGVAAFVALLQQADLPTQPWYYLPLMVFGAVCLDAILAGCHRFAPPLLLGLGAATAVAAVGYGWPAMKCRQTNADLVSARLTAEATRDDYIVVYPWNCGISFARYYRGAAPWTTLPALADCRIHRYDLLKEKLCAPDPLRPVFDRAAATLTAGHSLWVVGELPPRLPGEPPVPPDLPPAPMGPFGWSDWPYSRVWGRQFAQFLAARAGQIELLPPLSTDRVNPFENLPVIRITGWRSPPVSDPAP